MTAGYELLYLVSASKSQTEVAEIIEQIGQLLTKHNFVPIHHKVWDQRKLAYPIKRIGQAYYVLAYFTGEPNMLNEFGKAIRLNTSVLRSMVVQHNDIDTEVIRFTVAKPPVPVVRPVPANQVAMAEIQMPEIDVAAGSTDITLELPKMPRMVSRALEQAKDEVTEDHQPSKPRKATLEDLDKKIEDILGGEIEL